MTHKSDTQATQHAPESISALKDLHMLAGIWNTEISIWLDKPTTISGQTHFEWMEEGPFLLQRGSVEHPDFPTGVAILGGDDNNGRYSMIYSDSRGVIRIYEMSINNEEWSLWREAPGFSQRFSGRFNDDGTIITGGWEKSTDGTKWEHDFDLTYTKID